MPYSWCTTRSPSAISVASAMNWSARLRRRGGRLMRSPSRSCSPTSASRSATKPRSTPSVTSDTAPAGLRRTAAQSSSCAASLKPCSRSRLASRSREPRVQAATTMPPALAAPAFGLAAQLVEHVDAGPPRAPGRRPARAGRRHRRRPRRPAWRTGENANSGPPASIASQPARSRYSRSGGSGRYGTSPSRGTALRAGVVVGDHLQPRRQHLVGLVVEADRGAGQIVEQRLHPLVEQRHPVLHAGMPPPFGDRQIDRVLGRRLAEQLAPAGAEAGDRRPCRAAPRRPGAGSGAGARSALRWVPGSKMRIDSMVSPNRSSRTGSGSPAGKMSMMPPRMAYSPGSITVPARP